MRAFSLFVSALALANMSQATPLVDTEFGQLDAELELEAGLPITKPNAVKLGEHVETFSKWLTEGASSSTEKVKDHKWKGSSSSEWGGEMVEYMRDEVTIDIDRDDLKKRAKAIKKSNQMFTHQVDKTYKFQEWNAAAQAAIGPYKAHIAGDRINN